MLTEPPYSTTRIHRMNRLGNKSDCVIGIIASVIWVTQLEWENRKMWKRKKKRKKRNIQIRNEKKCVDVRHWHLILMPELASRFSRARSIKVHSLGPFFYLAVIFDWFNFSCGGWNVMNKRGRNPNEGIIS